jgi:hypothetical protein
VKPVCLFLKIIVDNSIITAKSGRIIKAGNSGTEDEVGVEEEDGIGELELAGIVTV